MGIYDVTNIGIDFGFDDMNADSAITNTAQKLQIDEACVKCKDIFGRVNLPWIAEKAGVSEKKAFATLHNSGAIFQDPSCFIDRDTWSYDGLKFPEQYLCGNLTSKLKIAEEVSQRFPMLFEREISALTKFMPKKVAFDAIHASFGASWISKDVYEEFLHKLLRVKKKQIQVHKVRGKYKIVAEYYARKTVTNTVTYGTARISALAIAERTLNAAPIKIYDYGSRRAFYDTRVLNKNATVAAQEKQELILREWTAWLNKNPFVSKRLEALYNDAFVGYAYSPYDGSFLSLPDLNPAITLYKHQRDAVARALLSENSLLLAHEVGAGKTYEMVVIAHEAKRMGISNKTMIVLPNNVIGDAVDSHRLLYPNDNILAVYPNEFTPKSRNRILEKIRDEDYIAVYMAYSSFDMIEMSRESKIARLENQIMELKAERANSSDYTDRNMLRSKIHSLAKSLEKMKAKEEHKKLLYFDELDVDWLIVDEAHNYKNISLNTVSDNIVGMNKKGSKKSDEMLAKARSVNKLIFATGTPLTNSLSDLYVMQSFLQPEELKAHGLESFDSWINTFAEREQAYEVDVDGNSLRLMTRFNKFHNLTELMSLFSSVCDFHFNTEADNLPKHNGYIDIICPQNPFQANFVKELIKRSEDVRLRKVARTEDNLLKICIDGRSIGLDDRLLVAEGIEKYFASRKTSMCADKIYELYNKYPGTAQVVFSDIGTPKSGFNVYDVLREELVELYEIPADEIAYVHDATTENKRKKLFEDVNKGKIRIIIGSSSKLGMGVNIQEKLIALHHLSVPWKPSDILQREGRIIRAFNSCDEVFLYRYIAPGTFDAYLWQILENKQKFISDFLSGTSQYRDAEDISEAVLNYAEIKAACIGDPLVKRRVETLNKIERVKILSAQKQAQLREAASIVAQTPNKIAELEHRREIICEDIEHYAKHKKKILKADRAVFGKRLLEELTSNDMMSEERFFNSYQGFNIMLPANMFIEKPYIYIRSENGVYYNDMSEVETPIGCTKSIDYVLEHLPERVEKLDEQIRNAHNDCDAARAEYNAGNTYETELSKLTYKLMEIDFELARKESEKHA